jgi:hypothetical protein
MHTYIHIYTYRVDLKYVYKHILLFTNHFMKKRNTQKTFQNIIVVQMYESEDSNAFSIKLLYILVFFFIDM